MVGDIHGEIPRTGQNAAGIADSLNDLLKAATVVGSRMDAHIILGRGSS
jgi:hypothetical protein